MKKYIFDLILKIDNDAIQDSIIDYIEELEDEIELLNHKVPIEEY